MRSNICVTFPSGTHILYSALSTNASDETVQKWYIFFLNSETVPIILVSIQVIPHVHPIFGNIYQTQKFVKFLNNYIWPLYSNGCKIKTVGRIFDFFISFDAPLYATHADMCQNAVFSKTNFLRQFFWNYVGTKTKTK